MDQQMPPQAPRGDPQLVPPRPVPRPLELEQPELPPPPLQQAQRLAAVPRLRLAPALEEVQEAARPSPPSPLFPPRLTAATPSPRQSAPPPSLALAVLAVALVLPLELARRQPALAHLEAAPLPRPALALPALPPPSRREPAALALARAAPAQRRVAAALVLVALHHPHLLELELSRLLFPVSSQPLVSPLSFCKMVNPPRNWGARRANSSLIPFFLAHI